MSRACRRFLAIVACALVAVIVLASACLLSMAGDDVLAAEEEVPLSPVEPIRVKAVGLSQDPSKARENSAYLQNLMDRLSALGGGVVDLPAGAFRFEATGVHDAGDFAIEARDNVKIVGAGQDLTVLMPVGTWVDVGLFEHGVDMFAYFGVEDGKSLLNADFEDFTIDGSLAQGSPDGYNASGKGFFFKLFEDCDWLRVTVCNTDGTGFGMDFPINCTVVDCVARGCGKNATPEDVGASGFGIGTGFSGLESIEIRGCSSFDNAKFGFFFEHQTRFASEVEALRARGYRVSDCVASGNLYNFGGARAHDVTYEHCTSLVSEDEARESYTVRAFCFENHSCRTAVIECEVEQRYSDIEDSDACYEAAHWALSKGLLESGMRDEGSMVFRPEKEMLRSEAVALLWRYAGRPGEVRSGRTPEMPDSYEDVLEGDYFVDAALWMNSIGDASLEEFRGSDPITRAEMVTMIWRMVGKPEVKSLPGFTDVDKDAYYSEALAWAVEQGFINGLGLSFSPEETCTRAEAVMLLKACDEALFDGLAGVLPKSIDMVAIQRLKAILGDEVQPRLFYVLDLKGFEA